MILNTMRVMRELEHRGVVPVDCSVGTRVDCLRGRLWITEWGQRTMWCWTRANHT